MWKLVKEALLPDQDYRDILTRMINVISQCPVCHKHSATVIPSKYHIWDKEEKFRSKTAYFKALTRRKCRFEMRFASCGIAHYCLRLGRWVCGGPLARLAINCAHLTFACIVTVR